MPFGRRAFLKTQKVRELGLPRRERQLARPPPKDPTMLSRQKGRFALSYIYGTFPGPDLDFWIFSKRALSKAPWLSQDTLKDRISPRHQCSTPTLSNTNENPNGLWPIFKKPERVVDVRSRPARDQVHRRARVPTYPRARVERIAFVSTKYVCSGGVFFSFL